MTPPICGEIAAGSISPYLETMRRGGMLVSWYTASYNLDCVWLVRGQQPSLQSQTCYRCLMIMYSNLRMWQIAPYTQRYLLKDFHWQSLPTIRILLTSVPIVWMPIYLSIEYESTYRDKVLVVSYPSIGLSIAEHRHPSPACLRSVHWSSIHGPWLRHLCNYGHLETCQPSYVGTQSRSWQRLLDYTQLLVQWAAVKSCLFRWSEEKWCFAQ